MLLNVFVARTLARSDAHTAWQADGCGFDLHARHTLYWRFGHEKNSTTILSLPLIQEGQLSVTDERCALSTGKLPRWHAQEKCGLAN